MSTDYDGPTQLTELTRQDGQNYAAKWPGNQVNVDLSGLPVGLDGAVQERLDKICEQSGITCTYVPGQGGIVVDQGLGFQVETSIVTGASRTNAYGVEVADITAATITIPASDEFTQESVELGQVINQQPVVRDIIKAFLKALGLNELATQQSWASSVMSDGGALLLQTPSYNAQGPGEDDLAALRELYGEPHSIATSVPLSNQVARDFSVMTTHGPAEEHINGTGVTMNMFASTRKENPAVVSANSIFDGYTGAVPKNSDFFGLTDETHYQILPVPLGRNFTKISGGNGPCTVLEGQAGNTFELGGDTTIVLHNEGAGETRIKNWNTQRLTLDITRLPSDAEFTVENSDLVLSYASGNGRVVIEGAAGRAGELSAGGTLDCTVAPQHKEYFDKFCQSQRFSTFFDGQCDAPPPPPAQPQQVAAPAQPPVPPSEPPPLTPPPSAPPHMPPPSAPPPSVPPVSPPPSTPPPSPPPPSAPPPPSPPPPSAPPPPSTPPSVPPSLPSDPALSPALPDFVPRPSLPSNGSQQPPVSPPRLFSPGFPRGDNALPSPPPPLPRIPPLPFFPPVGGVNRPAIAPPDSSGTWPAPSYRSPIVAGASPPSQLAVSPPPLPGQGQSAGANSASALVPALLAGLCAAGVIKKGVDYCRKHRQRQQAGGAAQGSLQQLESPDVLPVDVGQTSSTAEASRGSHIPSPLPSPVLSDNKAGATALTFVEKLKQRVAQRRRDLDVGTSSTNPLPAILADNPPGGSRESSRSGGSKNSDASRDSYFV